MYKNIKRIISLMIVMVSLTIIEPVKDFNFGINAYAVTSTYSDAKDGQLTSLEMKKSDGQSIDLYDDYDGNKTQLTDTTFYYTRTNASDNKIIVSASAKGTGYVVKLFESDRKNAIGHDMGEEINIVKGKSILYLRTFTSQETYKRAQDNENVSGSEKIYKIYINNIGSTGQDNIYLDRLTIDGGSTPLAFDYKKSTYDVAVKESEDIVEIKAVPENEDYSVKINNNSAREDNKYIRKVNLNKGKNTIEIRVQDYDCIKEKIYTLNVYRGIPVPESNTNLSTDKSKTSTEAVTNNPNSTNIKVNQWVQLNNSWQYNDSMANPMRSTWFYDMSNGNNYYLQENGALAIGWININGTWYYSNALGIRQIGWQNINGQWYYLNSDGIMVKDTTIDGYKLGSDGAWVK